MNECRKECLNVPLLPHPSPPPQNKAAACGVQSDGGSVHCTLYIEKRFNNRKVCVTPFPKLKNEGVLLVAEAGDQIYVQTCNKQKQLLADGSVEKGDFILFVFSMAQNPGTRPGNPRPHLCLTGQPLLPRTSAPQHTPPPPQMPLSPTAAFSRTSSSVSVSSPTGLARNTRPRISPCPFARHTSDWSRVSIPPQTWNSSGANA